MTTTSRAPIARRTGGTLTVPQGSALTIGAVLGTGVITLPALAVDLAGPASLVAWGALVLLSIPLATTFAAMGARHPDRGGVSAYVALAFGPRAAGAVGWCFYFAVPVGAPPATLMAGGYVADALGVDRGAGRGIAMGVAVAMIVGVAAMNMAGLRLSGRVQLILTGTLITVMVVAVLVALPKADPANLTPFAPNGLGAIGSAAALLVWGFAGWEAVAPLSAEYRRPGRDVPRATAIALVVVGVLYLALAGTTVLVLGASAAGSAAPLSDLLAGGLGHAARVVTAILAVLLTVGAVNAYFAGGSRLGTALARDGALPAWVAPARPDDEDREGRSPRRSLLLFAGQALVWLAIAEIADLSLHALMMLATGCFTLVYVLGTAAAVRLLPRRTTGWWAALIALVSVCGLLVLIGLNMLWALGICAASLLYQRARAGRSRRRDR